MFDCYIVSNGLKSFLPPPRELEQTKLNTVRSEFGSDARVSWTEAEPTTTRSKTMNFYN